MRGNIAIQTMAVVLGAHVRVGNEDNIWDAHRNRWQSVNWAIKMAEQFGRKTVTVEEARKIMNVGSGTAPSRKPYSILDSPPNRADFQAGFLTYQTDGHLPETVERPSLVSIL